MKQDTIKLDVKTATLIHHDIENLARQTQITLQNTKRIYQQTLPYFQGKGRKVYEDISQKSFQKYEEVIQDMFDISQFIEDVSLNYLEFDISRTR